MRHNEQITRQEFRKRQTRQIIARLSAAGFRIGWVGRTNHEYLFVRP